MPKPPKNPTLTRIATVRYRPDEYTRLDGAAADRGMTFSMMIRAVTVGLDLPGPRPPMVDREAVETLRRLGGLLNQFIAILHRQHDLAVDEETRVAYIKVVDVIQQIHQAVTGLMERLR